MGLGCLVEAGLFGDNILHRRSPDLQTFSPLFVLSRNHRLSGLFRFARGSCDRKRTYCSRLIQRWVFGRLFGTRQQCIFERGNDGYT